MSNQKVIVVGAGVIGCATAYLLARHGFAVTVIEAEPGPGLMTSYANGAQLSYSYVEPLASPATLKKLPSLLLDPQSPLRFRVTGEWAQIVWGFKFIRACTQAHVKFATKALLGLSFLSRNELELAIERDRLSFDYSRPGKLVIYNTPEAIEVAKKQMEFQRTLGCQQTLLSTHECLEREPALENYQSYMAGGVWTPGEAVGDAKKLCDDLARHSTKMGATFRYLSNVENFIVQRDRIQAAVLESGERLEADYFVLASGNGAASLGKKLGLSLPVYPLKGYSLSLTLRAPAKAPQVSVTDLRRKIVYACLANKLRVAGMAELVGYDWSVSEKKLQFLMQCTEETFPGACDFHTDIAPWVGLRPVTPTSLPMIGPARFTNFLLNVGHGSLGFTLALGSARLIVAYLNKQTALIAQQGWSFKP